MTRQRPPNEFEIDDAWQRGIFDRLLRPVLHEASYQNQIVFFGVENPVAKLLQKRAHVDILAQTPRGSMSIEVKIVRWPGAKEGRPSWHHWPYVFLETWSCTIPGHKQQGWLVTSEADILLWCQCSCDERSLDCFPFPFKRLRDWVRPRWHDLPKRDVPNVIEGRALWTKGKLALMRELVPDLRIKAFTVDERGLICDLFGKPLLSFMRGDA